jgi:beta-galactosidase
MNPDIANLERRLWFGSGYYPEWVDRPRWIEDARQMKVLGLNCVRLGDFCWSRLEPREGEYQLDWLEEAIGILGDNGIRTMLTLPTAGPPRWVSLQYPETLPVRRDGQRMPFGSRNHLCINAPAGQRLNIGLLKALLERFAKNPNIFSWALGNEIGKHFSCFCSICLQLFQNWLLQRYITIDKLNEAWGTVFWSQEYAGFDQVVFPLERPNPSLHLDWQRFRSDSMIRFCRPQIDRIHERAPGTPVTVNFRLAPDEHDCFELARALDVVGAIIIPVR